LIIHSSGHLGVANSRALEIAGITSDTPQPQGGHIRKDPSTGEPNGVIEEDWGVVGRHIPPLTEEQRLEELRWCWQPYVSRGVTTAVIASGNATGLHDLELAHKTGWIPFRVITMSSWAPGGRSNAEAGGLLTGFGDEWLKLGAIKIWADGSLQ
jgi:predicted amidohydrolase YtcJ